ncbi:MAG: hypothetical protein ACLTR6_05840 [Clostridium fessum]
MKRSILLDSQADLISYGMGERSIVEIADALASGIEAKDITFIEGTACKAENPRFCFTTKSVFAVLPRVVSLRDKKTYAESFLHPVQQHRSAFRENASLRACAAISPSYVVQNPAAKTY